jgi:hypothetical protein
MNDRARKKMLMAVQDADWSFAPATPLDCNEWSHGTINTVPDLYSPGIFGLQRNFRCECGKTSGEWSVGLPCPECRTWVTADADKDRRRQMAKIELACDCDHPLMGAADEAMFEIGYVSTFPVCPIFYRVYPDGTPNSLGLKYERLVEMNAEMTALLPSDDDPGYFAARDDLDATGLVQAMRDIIGIDGSGRQSAEEALFPLLWRAVISLDPDVAPVARSCLLTIRLRARI